MHLQWNLILSVLTHAIKLFLFEICDLVSIIRYLTSRPYHERKLFKTLRKIRCLLLKAHRHNQFWILERRIRWRKDWFYKLDQTLFNIRTPSLQIFGCFRSDFSSSWSRAEPWVASVFIQGFFSLVLDTQNGLLSFSLKNTKIRVERFNCSRDVSEYRRREHSQDVFENKKRSR